LIEDVKIWIFDKGEGRKRRLERVRTLTYSNEQRDKGPQTNMNCLEEVGEEEEREEHDAEDTESEVWCISVTFQ